MKFKVNYKHIIFFLLFVSVSCLAQEPPFISRAIFESDYVRIKWLPKDVITMQDYLRTNVVVEKYDSNGSLLMEFPILVLPEIDTLNYPLSTDRATIEGLNSIDSILQRSVLEGYSENDIQWYYFAMLFGLESNWTLAKELGFAFEDNSVNQNQSYRYDIVIRDKENNEVSRLTHKVSYPQVVPKPFLGKPELHCDKNVITVALIMTDTVDINYSSYYIEKSLNDGLTYDRINELPILSNQSAEGTKFLLYKDSIEQTDHPIYRIYAKNSFGELSPYSDTVAIKPCDIPYHIPIILDGYEMESKKRVELKWSFPDSSIVYLSGFNIYRQPAEIPDDSLYLINEKLLAPDVFSFIDEIPLRESFYYIEAVYQDGFALMSWRTLIQLEDFVAPESPQFVAGDIDTTTTPWTVMLKWNKSMATDLQGYRVYRSEQNANGPVVITPYLLTDTTLLDSLDLNPYTRNLFYTVTALDKNWNESYLSDKLRIRIPDMTPPLGGELIIAKPTEGGVSIQWTGSPSPDVAYYQLNKRVPSSVDWSSIQIQENVDGLEFPIEFIDHNIPQGDSAFYRLITVDSSDNRAYSEEMLSWRYESPYIDGIEFFEYVINQRGKHYLYWDYPEGVGVKSFYFYGRENELDVVRAFETVNAEEALVREGIVKDSDPNRSYALYRLELTPRQKLFMYFRMEPYNHKGKTSSAPSTWIKRKEE